MEYQRLPIDRDGLISRSWQRCVDAGLQAGSLLPEPGIGPASLADRLEANSRLVAYAQPVIEGLYQHLARSSSMVLLADSSGTVLRSIGDSSFMQRAERVRLQPGANWSELSMGTNAIGTALVEQRTVEVIGNQHFFERNQFLTCIATPILAPCGGILGVLDISSEATVAQTHAAALVEMTAGMLEDRLIESMPEAGVVLRLHTAIEALGSPLDAIAVFAENGRLLAANRRLRNLRLPELFVGRDFSTWFNLPWKGILEHGIKRGLEPMLLRSRDGRNFLGRVIIASKTGRPASHRTPRVICGEAPKRCLDDLGSEDPRMAEAIRRASRIAECDIPLLIQGETGSGKEWFAQAFHNSSTRRDGPFIAVNCAAIPSTLIEAELFGYVDGAFTGARRLGARGKIREANGGTLFLDEIGDMPLSLQAVLLRVLETRRVTPLGSEVEEAVDVMLVCASHQALRDLVGNGLFRADLFFRLSGMTVSLPALRERSDFDTVVRRILAEEGSRCQVRLLPESLALLRRYSWPGNLRQLRNVLRLSVALLGDDCVLSPDLLPAEIIDCPSPPADSGLGLRAVQIRLARDTVERHKGNISAAARELGITRTTLYRKLKQAETSDC